MAKPSYISRTFLATGSGFQLDGKITFDVWDQTLLQSADHWTTLVIALERSKSGNFDCLQALPELMKKHKGMEFWDCCITLLGYAAPRSLLTRMVEDFGLETNQASNDVLISFAEILANAMQIWSVPILLNCYLRSSNRNKVDLIPCYLSDILEENRGPIFNSSTPVDVYESTVRNSYQALCKKIGSEDYPVKCGMVFGVRSASRRFFEKLEAPDFDVDEILDDRMWFEASTGIDCRQFYDPETGPQPLAAAAIFEQFLEASGAEKYEEGIRYFFGHRIPD